MIATDTVIIGASCWAAGQVLAGKDVVVIERGALIGTEYFDSCRRSEPAKPPFRTKAAQELYWELDARGKTGDAFALAPLLYKKLEALHGKFRLWTEISSVARIKNGYKIVTADVSGGEEIRCRRIIDSTPECRSRSEFGQANITGCRIASAILVPDAAALAKWKKAPFAFRPGRTADEFYAEFPLNPATSWPEARKMIVAAWESRPAALKDARMISLGKTRDYDVKENFADFGGDYCYFNSASFANALAAIDTVEVKSC